MFSNVAVPVSLLLLVVLHSVPSARALLCYHCANCIDATCDCATTVEVNADDSYCALVRSVQSGDITFEIRPLPRNWTNRYESDPHFVSAREWIVYDSDATAWTSTTDLVAFGCQTDRCNRPELLRMLPANGLSLSLPSDWLENNLRRRPDQISSSCNECPDERLCGARPGFVDPTQCPVEQCQGLCLMGELVQKESPTSFCYELFCFPSDTRQPSVYLNAMYHINNRELELYQTDVVCSAPNCSRLEIFQNIKDNVQKNYDGIKPFLPAGSERIVPLPTILALAMICVRMSIFA